MGRTRQPSRSGVDGRTEMRAFQQSLPMALMRAREAVMRRFRPILAAHDLTEQQWRVLRALVDADGPLSVGELAERTFLLGPSLSRMLASMEERQLIQRSSGAGDARRAELTVAAAGIELFARVAPLSEAAYDDITARLGGGELDDGELDRLYDLLARVAEL